jgi:hypothetical protein
MRFRRVLVLWYAQRTSYSEPYDPKTLASSLADVSKLSAVAFAIELIEARQTATIRAKSTAYSTAVGPSSSRSSRVKRVIMLHLLGGEIVFHVSPRGGKGRMNYVLNRSLPHDAQNAIDL